MMHIVYSCLTLYAILVYTFNSDNMLTLIFFFLPVQCCVMERVMGQAVERLIMGNFAR